MRSKYETHVLPRLEEVGAWARDGVSEEQIAKNLGIAYSTFKLYKTNNSALSAVLKENKDYVDNVVVVNALLKRLKGYDTEESKTVYRYVDDGTGKQIEVLESKTVTKKHIPGDPRAAEFWLSRRRPDLWSENNTPDQEDGSGVVLLPAVLGEEE